MTMKKWLAPLWGMAGAAVAHEGHGLAGSHAHATDAWGFIVGAAVVAVLALWWRGRR
jgi:hypothetical protein